MKIFIVVVVTIFAVGCGGDPPTIIDGDFAFLNVNVLPMDDAGERVLERQIVMIENGRVSLIGDIDQFSVAEDVTSVDAEDYFLMPGLTEMHGHLPNPRMSDEDVRNLLFLYVANGVTTVRGMQGDPSQFALRSAIERGRLLGPKLYLASVSMNGTSVTTPEEASQRAREYKVDGYDLIKTHEGMRLDVFDALAETASEVNIPFGGQIKFNMHYAANGIETTDRTRVGLQFYPKGVVPERKLISAHVGDDEDLDIPAGESNVRHDGFYRLKENAQITAFQAHLHNLGKRQCLGAVLPDNSKQILSCADWDFGWHIVYNYEDHVMPLLPKGTTLHVTSWHDNSEANRWNDDPTNWAGFGQRSSDEMSFAWVSWYDLDDESFEKAVEEREMAADNNNN